MSKTNTIKGENNVYFKFNDKSEIVIDTNSILYALIIDTPEEFGIRIYLKKEVMMK